MVTSLRPIRSISFCVPYFYNDVTIFGEELQHLGFSSLLTPFEQEGVFIMPYPLWHETLPVYTVQYAGTPFIAYVSNFQSEPNVSLALDRIGSLFLICM